MVVDGIDFSIHEPRRNGFSSMWYSKKSNGPGVRYEVATSISNGRIVWLNGPYPCGKFPDLVIFRLKLRSLLLPMEKVWGDLVYRDLKCITKQDAIDQQHLEEINRARARHEVVNGRLSKFGALHQHWRHDLNKHYLAMQSACVIHNLECELWGPPFDCKSTRDRHDV